MLRITWFPKRCLYLSLKFSLKYLRKTKNTDSVVFAGGYAGAAWRYSRCPCPASCATPCSRGSTSAWRLAIRPPPREAAGVRTTATTQPQSERRANSRVPTVLFHPPQTATRDSWDSRDDHQQSSSLPPRHLQSYQERTKDQKEQFVIWKESRAARTGERIKNQVLKRIECVCNLRWPSLRCMQQPTTATTTTTWCWIWAAVSHSWELCLAGLRAGQKPVLAHQARPQPPFKRAGTKHSYIWRQFAHQPRQGRAASSSGRLQLQILSDSIQPYVERAARGKIEELNHYGSKLKSLSC